LNTKSRTLARKPPNGLLRLGKAFQQGNEVKKQKKKRAWKSPWRCEGRKKERTAKEQRWTAPRARSPYSKNVGAFEVSEPLDLCN